MSDEDYAVATEGRISRLEGAYEQVDRRLGEMAQSIRTLIVVVATIGTAILGGIIALAIRGG